MNLFLLNLQSFAKKVGLGKTNTSNSDADEALSVAGIVFCGIEFQLPNKKNNKNNRFPIMSNLRQFHDIFVNEL